MENGPPKPDINWSWLVADSRGEQELGESISSATGELTDPDTRPDHPCMDLDKNQLKQMGAFVFLEMINTKPHTLKRILEYCMWRLV